MLPAAQKWKTSGYPSLQEQLCQREKLNTVEYFKDQILFYQTEIDVNNKMIEVIQGKGGEEAYMEYLVKIIESTRNRIATINGIIDALEAKIVENNAGGTTEE